MFKTISAALLAVSVLAAPAFAATKTAPVSNAAPAKASVLNANAKMSGHHKHVRHHRHHKMGALKTTHTKISFKRTPHTAAKRG